MWLGTVFWHFRPPRALYVALRSYVALVHARSLSFDAVAGHAHALHAPFGFAVLRTLGTFVPFTLSIWLCGRTRRWFILALCASAQSPVTRMLFMVHLVSQWLAALVHTPLVGGLASSSVTLIIFLAKLTLQHFIRVQFAFFRGSCMVAWYSFSSRSFPSCFMHVLAVTHSSGSHFHAGT